MNCSEIIFKTKTASEEDILLHLQTCSSNFIPDLNETVNIPESSKKIFSRAITFEAWVGDKLIGLVASYMNDTVTHQAFITSVSVYKEYFGTGVALEILSMCIHYAEIHRFSTISLEVNKQNNVAVKLYEKYGFKIFAEEGKLFLMKLEIL